MNFIEDKKERIDEIKEIIRVLNWRLRPETAKDFEQQTNQASQIPEEHLQILDKLFEKG